MFLRQKQSNDHVHYLKIWRRNIECADLHDACDRRLVPHAMHSH